MKKRWKILIGIVALLLLLVIGYVAGGVATDKC